MTIAHIDEPKADTWLAGLRSQPKLRPSWMLPDTAEWAPVWPQKKRVVAARSAGLMSRYRHRGRHRKPSPAWRDRLATFGEWCYRTFVEIRVGE